MNWTNEIDDLAKAYGMSPFKDEPRSHFESRVLSVKRARERSKTLTDWSRWKRTDSDIKDSR